MGELRAKFEKLNEEEKEELNEILNEPDDGVDELTKDSFLPSSFMSMQTYDEKKIMLSQLLAWMDAHPVEVTQAEIDAAIELRE